MSVDMDPGLAAVLQNADPATASEIIALQIEDAEAPAIDGDTEAAADAIAARDLYLDELRNYQLILQTEAEEVAHGAALTRSTLASAARRKLPRAPSVARTASTASTSSPNPRFGQVSRPLLPQMSNQASQPVL